MALAPAKLPAIEEPAPSALGELVIQELTGLPVIWKPLDPTTGRSQFDAHPEGEGYSLKDWEADRDSGLYSEKQLAAWQSGCFLRVRCTKAEADAHWGEVEMPAPDPVEAVKALLGTTTVKLDEALAEIILPAPEPVLARQLVKAYTPAALAGAARTYALDANIIRKEWLASATAVPVTPEEVAEKSEGLDTKANALLTVGTGKSYSTISAAVTAASSGDSIETFATDANTYAESVAYGAKVLSIACMVANKALIITSASATAVVTGSSAAGTSYLYNFTITQTNAGAGSCVQCTNTANVQLVVVGCRANSGFISGFEGASSSVMYCYNCEAVSCGTGFARHGAAPFTLCFNCTAVKCTRGFSGTACTPVWCLAAGNSTADFGTVSRANNNVSGDATATVPGSATGFATTDFEDYANNDLRLKASVAATTVARLYGSPNTRETGNGSIRRRHATGYVYAGAHDPDPGVIPTGAAVDPTLFTAFGLDNELTAAFDAPALTSVVAPDTLRGVTGTSDKLYSAAEEASRNTVVTPLSAVPSPANGGPAIWKQLGVNRVGTGDKVLSYDEEEVRNTLPDVSLIPSPATGGPAAWKWIGTTNAGTLNLTALLVAAEAAGYAAAEALYATWEAGRNNDNGTVAGDIATGKSVKIRNVTTNGSATSGAPAATFSIILDAAVYAVAATATVTGGLTMSADTTGALVTLTRKKKSDGSTVAVLINAVATNFTAGVQKTWATIKGSACTFAPTVAQEEYLDASISGGTPTVTSETSGQAGYVVKPGAPAWGAVPLTAGDGTVTLSVVAAAATDIIYARSRAFLSTGAWAAESETFKRTGTGTIVITGAPLANEVYREFTAYAKVGGVTSDWLEPKCAAPTAGAAAVIDQIMDAVVAQINLLALTVKTEAGVSASVTAEKEIPPDFDAVNTPIVKVFPDTESAEASHNELNEVKPRVNIVLCQRAKNATQQAALLKAREQLRDAFLGKRLVGMSEQYCEQETESGVLDQDALWERFLWASPITLEFVALRAHG